MPHNRPHPFTVLLLYAAGGAVGGVILALFAGLDPAPVMLTALSGAVILPVAEAGSWLGRSRWTQGLLFGAVVGVLMALAADLITSPETGLLKLLIAYVTGGMVGGLIFIEFSGLARPEVKEPGNSFAG